jgi:uncharacterized membrane protein YqjE
MEEETNQSNQDIVSLIKEYIATRIEIVKLSVIERVTTVLPVVIISAVLVVLITLGVIFGSVTLALYIGDQLGSNTKGFGIVTLIYLVLGLIIYFIKDGVEKKLTDSFVKNIFRSKE